MLASLTVRDRRALIFGAGAIAALVVTVRGIPAWWRWRAEARGSTAELMTRAGQSDVVVGGLPRALDSLEARTARLTGLRSAPVTGDSPSDAGANLVAYVAEAARAARVRIDAAELHVDTAATHMLPRITVDVQAAADVGGLAALLHALERGPTLVAVRRLQLRADHPDSPGSETEMLTIRFTAEAPVLVPTRGGRQ